ncbi:MAG TPA: hypothetical protein VMH87_13575 [Pseudomonadales bacterium]|nr:hypothetical protein [Pseudomonadales bacterium]
MTFQQPANLNRYIAPPAPFTWGSRWNLFKLLLPVLVLTAFLLFQSILLEDLTRDHWEPLPFLIITGLLFFIYFSMEFQWRVAGKGRKFLELGENYIRTGYGLVHRGRWQNIIGWQFNNVANESNYRVVTVEYKWGYKGKKLGRHRLVLEKRQMDQLISEVKSRQQKEGLAFSIMDEETNFIPKPREIKNIGLAKMCVDTAGPLLFMEGFFFFVGSLGLKDDSPDPNFVPNPHGSFTKFMEHHFSSGVEFQNFLFVTGAILCGSGLVLMIWSRLVLKEKLRPTDPTDGSF